MSSVKFHENFTQWDPGCSTWSNGQIGTMKPFFVTLQTCLTTIQMCSLLEFLQEFSYLTSLAVHLFKASIDPHDYLNTKEKLFKTDAAM